MTDPGWLEPRRVAWQIRLSLVVVGLNYGASLGAAILFVVGSHRWFLLGASLLAAGAGSGVLYSVHRLRRVWDRYQEALARLGQIQRGGPP